MIDVVFVMMIVCLVMVGMIITTQFEYLKELSWNYLNENSLGQPRDQPNVYMSQCWEQEKQELQHELLRRSNANLMRQAIVLVESVKMIC